MKFGDLDSATSGARNQVYANPQYGNPVIKSYRIEGGQSCFFGWTLNGEYLGVIAPIEQLLNNEDRTSKIETIGEINLLIVQITFMFYNQ